MEVEVDGDGDGDGQKRAMCHVANDRLNSEDLENSVKKEFYRGRLLIVIIALTTDDLE